MKRWLVALSFIFAMPALAQGTGDLVLEVWPQHKAAIEKHWKAYVNGETTQAEAIKSIVAAMKADKKPREEP